MERLLECMGMDVAKSILNSIWDGFFEVAKSHCEGCGYNNRSWHREGFERGFFFLVLAIEVLLYIACRSHHASMSAFRIMSSTSRCNKKDRRREWTSLMSLANHPAKDKKDCWNVDSLKQRYTDKRHVANNEN